MNPEKLIQIKSKIQKLLERADRKGASHTLDDAVQIENEAATAMRIAQQLMSEYKLEEADFYKSHPEIEYKPLIGVSTIENPFLSKRPKESRKPWSEFLASSIAIGNLCKVTVNSIDGKLSFYGVDFNRDIAILMFEKIGNMALGFCNNEMEKAKKMVGKSGFDIKTKKVVKYPSYWMGDDFFIDNFMFGWK